MVLKLRDFRQQTRNTVKILKGRAGYLDRSVKTKYYTESKKKGISYVH
jgi:hypothetical protein